MKLPPPPPQTLPRVLFDVALATAVFGAMEAFRERPLVDPRLVALGMVRGVSFAIALTAFRYHRLPESGRLAPVHTIGLGVLGVAVVLWVLTAREDPVTFDLISWAPALLLALPAIYLAVLGIRRLLVHADRP